MIYTELVPFFSADIKEKNFKKQEITEEEDSKAQNMHLTTMA